MNEFIQNLLKKPLELVMYFSLVFLFLNILFLLVRKGLVYLAKKSRTKLDDFIFIQLVPTFHLIFCVCALY